MDIGQIDLSVVSNRPTCDYFEDHLRRFQMIALSDVKAHFLLTRFRLRFWGVLHVATLPSTTRPLAYPRDACKLTCAAAEVAAYINMSMNLHQSAFLLTSRSVQPDHS